MAKKDIDQNSKVRSRNATALQRTMTIEFPDYWAMQKAIREASERIDSVEHFRRHSLLPPSRE
jgi:hypothetical protein